jgi:hypothetical protein
VREPVLEERRHDRAGRDRVQADAGARPVRAGAFRRTQRASASFAPA